MATHRYISTTFWDDAWIQELDPSEKFVYLYLITNPLTSISGVYKITDRRISFDTGYDAKTVKSIMDKFSAAKKAFRFGEWIIIPTSPKHQSLEKNPNLVKGIVSELEKLPEDIFNALEEFGYKFDLSLVPRQKGKAKEKEGKPENRSGSQGSPIILSNSIQSDQNSIQSEFNINSNGPPGKNDPLKDPEIISQHFIRLWQHNGTVFNPLARIKQPKDWDAFWKVCTLTEDEISDRVANFIEAVESGEIEHRFIPRSPDAFVINGWLQTCAEPYKKQKTRISNDVVKDVSKYFKEI